MPINDIRGIDSMMYAKGEKQLRYFFRLLLLARQEKQ